MEELVDATIEKMISTYSTLSRGQWQLVRTSILKYLQGRKVKVSLFLQQRMQTLDGTLVLSNNTALPFGVEVPGSIRYYDNNACVRTRMVSNLDVGSDGEPSNPLCKALDDAFDINSTLGLNLFSKDAVAQAAAADKSTCLGALNAMHSTYNGGVDQMTSHSPAKMSGGNYSKTTQASAKAELNMLSDLLGLGGAGGKETDDSADGKSFKINLFPDTSFADSKDGDKSSGGLIMIDIDGTVGSKTVETYMSELGFKDDEKPGSHGSKGQEDDDDDLLAMMDAASK